MKPANSGVIFRVFIVVFLAVSYGYFQHQHSVQCRASVHAVVRYCSPFYPDSDRNPSTYDFFRFVSEGQIVRALKPSVVHAT